LPLSALGDKVNPRVLDSIKAQLMWCSHYAGFYDLSRGTSTRLCPFV